MAKIAIKNENITSFGGIYHLWTFSQSWALKNLPNLYWANVEVAAKHSAMEVFSALSLHSQHSMWRKLCARNLVRPSVALKRR